MTVTENKSNGNLQERLVALTRDLILIPSIPSRLEDRRRCYEFVKNHLESLDTIEVREFEKNGIPSLVAATPGCLKPDILMCGHLDVITHPDITVYRSHIKDGRIYGPGAGDMKGALAILLEVFRQIHTKLPKASLGIAVTADEEVGGESGIGYLFKENGLRCQEAMIPDGGSLNEITVEEKGILHLKLHSHGHAAHAARPWLGDNALEKLMDCVIKIRSYFEELKGKKDHWYPTVSVTMMATENRTINRIPSTASVGIDIRFPPPYTTEKMLTQMREILPVGIEAEIIISAEPTQLSPDPLYAKMTEQVTGEKVIFIRDDGGSDARFICAHGIPVVMSRPLVGNVHAEDEWIDIASMVKLYHIYEKYLLAKLK